MTLISLTVDVKKVLLVLPLALFLVAANQSQASVVCDVDGVEVKFSKERVGSIELEKSLKPKDIVGVNLKDRQVIGLKPAGERTANFANGKFTVDSLGLAEHSNHGLRLASFAHVKRNAWEVEFPRGMYEFDNKEDLLVEVITIVSEGQASHLLNGGSSVTLEVEKGTIHEFWWGGTNSLRRLRGDLVFSYSDFVELAADGVHRATLELCVNIRGNT